MQLLRLIKHKQAIHQRVAGSITAIGRLVCLDRTSLCTKVG
jgi:hypothetical protein